MFCLLYFLSATATTKVNKTRNKFTTTASPLLTVGVGVRKRRKKRPPEQRQEQRLIQNDKFFLPKEQQMICLQRMICLDVTFLLQDVLCFCNQRRTLMSLYIYRLVFEHVVYILYIHINCIKLYVYIYIYSDSDMGSPWVVPTPAKNTHPMCLAPLECSCSGAGLDSVWNCLNI